MTTPKLSDAITRLGRSVAPLDAATSDSELLNRFLVDRDEQAFALLVRRHGGTVFGVCRRVTGSHHLAEDAFQAVFVVLAAKAGSVRPRAALSAWLYGVAYRTALRARTMADRRNRRETLVETLPDAAGSEANRADTADIAALLDEEIAGLAEHLRVPVVMCELEGRSRQDVAGELGIPEGTLSSRLAAARKALAGRLRKRGVALSAAGLTAAFGQLAGANVPADLTARAVAAVVTPGVLPAAVADLSNGVLRVMFAHKLKTVSYVALLAVAALTGGLLLAADAPQPDSPPPNKPLTSARPFAFPDEPKPLPPVPKAEAKPLPKGPNKLLVFRDGGITLMDPDGKNEAKVTKNRGEYHPSGASLSPDGKQIAVLIPGPLPPDDGVPGAKKRVMILHVRGLEEKEPGTSLGVECQLFFWSPDGTEIACSDFVDGMDKVPEATHFIVNVKTKEKTALKLPASHLLTDWSRDGKLFLTTGITAGGKSPEARLFLMNRDGTEHKALTDAKQVAMLGRIAPDGKRVLFNLVTFPPKEKPGQPKRELAVVEVATGTVTKVADTPLNGDIQGYCWSPDSKQIAYTWRQVHDGKPEDVINKETESHLVVCDWNGKNQKTIVTEKGTGQWHVTLGQVDWR